MKEKVYCYKGEETNYIVYEDGRVFDKKKNKFIIPFYNNSGYATIGIYIGKKSYIRSIHRLVAETFIPNPENKPQVNHIDGNKQNNHVSNLEWNSPSENRKHAYRTGLHKPLPPEKVTFTKFSIEQIEVACEEMEKDELSLYDIYRITGVNEKILADIRIGNIWKSISYKYKFPEDPVKTSKIGLTHMQTKKLRELARYNNLSGNKILEILDITKKKKRKKSLKAISWYRSQFKKKNKDQRPMKTIQEIELMFPTYEEELLFKWEL